MENSLYKLKSVNRKQLILQAPAGGLRVVGLEGTSAHRTPSGYVVSTPVMVYAISSEDYLRLNQMLKTPA